MHKVVKNAPEFRAIYNSGNKLIFPYYFIYFSVQESGGLYCGLTVTKKIGNAVIRNRVKRRFRAMIASAFSEQFNSLHVKIVIVARKYAINADFNRMVQSIKSIKFKNQLLSAEHEAN